MPYLIRAQPDASTELLSAFDTGTALRQHRAVIRIDTRAALRQRRVVIRILYEHSSTTTPSCDPH